MRPVGMAGDLRLLPGRQLGVDLGERLRGLAPRAGRSPRRWRRRRPPRRASAVPGPCPAGRRPVFRNRGSCASGLSRGGRMPAGRCGPAKRRQTGLSPGLSSMSTAASLAAFGERVVLGDQRAQPLLEHVGVDLRRRDVGMAEQLLHDAEIGAVLQEVAGEGVAQHVRRDLRRRNAGGGGELLEVAGEGLAGQVAALAERREQPRAVAAAGRVARREIGARPPRAPCR